MLKDTDFITIGKVLRPQGLAGFVRVNPMTDDPERFSLLETVRLRKDHGDEIFLHIEKIVSQRGFLLIKFAEVGDRDQAEALRNAAILISRDACLPLPEASYYIFDIIGLRVQTKNGREVGVVTDVLEYPANDVYVVQKGDQEILIPAVSSIVKKIDMDSATIIIEPIDGLLPDVA